MVVFDSQEYITSFKTAFINATNDHLGIPYSQIVQGTPDITEGGMSLSEPVVYLEIVNTDAIDRQGKNDGNGGKIKRDIIRLSLQIISSGHNQQILARDRIINKIHAIEDSANRYAFAEKGIRKPLVRNMGSYRVREGVHLARMEIFVEVLVRK
jgi:hypothetical protein